MWPANPAELAEEQRRIAALTEPPWEPRGPMTVGGCFICFGRGASGPGAAGDPGWAAAAVLSASAVVATSHVTGVAGGPYLPGLLALREGPLLRAAVAGLPAAPDVLIVNATGRDHPRRAGLALHLGWALRLPSIGVTHRPLVATGDEPGPAPGDVSALHLAGEVVGAWLRVAAGVRPLAVHPGWRTSVGTAVAVVEAATGRVRTPLPLREARRLARRLRAGEAP